jgi:hypothetical protein
MGEGREQELLIKLFDAKLLPLTNGIDAIKLHMKKQDKNVEKNTNFRVRWAGAGAAFGVVFTILNNLPAVKNIIIAML